MILQERDLEGVPTDNEIIRCTFCGFETVRLSWPRKAVQSWMLWHYAECSDILDARTRFTLGLAFKTVSKTPPKQHLQTHCDPHVSTFSPREIIGSTILSFLNIYAYFGYARGHSSDPFFTKMLHHVNNFKLDRSTTDSIPMLYSKNIDLTAKAEAVAIMLKPLDGRVFKSFIQEALFLEYQHKYAELDELASKFSDNGATLMSLQNFALESSTISAADSPLGTIAE
ncbi:hypothetical protein M3Y96_00589700 [Aphelenchoides besseyi]|nr:hypothetical protein M3Y96_00589700 [Aphelenchoides besseyi]